MQIAVFGKRKTAERQADGETPSAAGKEEAESKVRSDMSTMHWARAMQLARESKQTNQGKYAVTLRTGLLGFDCRALRHRRR